MNNSIIIRPMKLEDLDQVMIVEKDAFITPWSRASFEAEIIENNLAYYLVIENSGGIFGYAGMWLILNEAHITNIAILSSFRGNGCGEMLLRTMIDHAKARKADSMTLEVRVSNISAQGLYAKLGFITRGIRPKYYADTQEDALIMWWKDE